LKQLDRNSAQLQMRCVLGRYDGESGGGSFASGFFYGILTSKSPEDTVKRGWARCALPYNFPGDTTMATLDQVRTFMQGGTARVQR